MHAIRANSPQSMVAGLVAKWSHSQRREDTKPAQRRRKADKRDYSQEIAGVLYGPGPVQQGVEL